MLRWQNADSALCPVKSPMVAWWNTGSAPQYGSKAHVAHLGALGVIDSGGGFRRAAGAMMVAWWNAGSAPQYGSNAHVAHIGALSVIDSVSGFSRPSENMMSA